MKEDYTQYIGKKYTNKNKFIDAVNEVILPETEQIIIRDVQVPIKPFNGSPLFVVQNVNKDNHLFVINKTFFERNYKPLEENKMFKYTQVTLVDLAEFISVGDFKDIYLQTNTSLLKIEPELTTFTLEQLSKGNFYIKEAK